MKPSYTDAIQSLAPGGQFVFRGRVLAGLEWLSTDIARPTDAAIEAELTRLTAEYDAAEYRRKRAEEYPPLDAVLVALWEAVIENRPSSAADLQVLREIVKQKYPKPVGG